VTALNKWGFAHHLVPRADGGRLGPVEELFALLRSVARRDLTVAVGFGATMLAALPVWSWGSDAQRHRLAGLISGGEFGSLGLSEPDHGSDLLASEVVARPQGEQFMLSGTKWPIGNATRGAFVTVLARTGDAGGPRGFSTLLVDKRHAVPGTWSCEPRVRTLGLRGGDISGISFHHCPLPATALVGARGAGLDVTLKTLQNTRTMLTALSLGAADTALRVALSHVQRRRLYGRSAYEIPVLREQLVAAYVDLLVAECVALPTARAITAAPRRLSLWSAVAKYLVPVIVDEVLASLREVLGARHFLREGREVTADGVFQKILRDHAIVSVFDGTTHVNLQIVASQLPAVLRGPASDSDLLPALFGFGGDAPDWRPTGPDLRLTNDGADEITQAWPAALTQLEKLCADAGSAAHDTLCATAGRVERCRQEHLAAVDAELRQQRNLHSSAAGFALAKRHCLLHAAAACTHTWLANQNGPHRRPEWLLLCLERILARLRPDHSPALPQQHVPTAELELLRCAREHRLFSHTPIRLGETLSTNRPSPNAM
jgi:alkylation response protein AidB-like acyl-CoA dehydrogenase